MQSQALDEVDPGPRIRHRRRRISRRRDWSLWPANPFERKLASRGEHNFGPDTRTFLRLLNSQIFVEFLEGLTGIPNLIPDPTFDGGGLHQILPGGLLKIHADFNKHPPIKLDRRLNVLIYLNKDCDESYGGHFELWDRQMKKAEKRSLPVFNRMAIFSTTDFSYHGHPEPLTCPPDRSRKSLALFRFGGGVIRRSKIQMTQVTVCIPAYRSERFIQKTLRSVQEQTFRDGIDAAKAG